MNTALFGDLFQFIRNGMSVKQDKSGDGLPISRIETISDGLVNPERVGFAGLTDEAAEGWLLEPGDILFSHINSVDHVGKCAVYRGIPGKLVHGMNLLNLRCDRSKASPEFAKHLIRSPGFRERLANFINKAVNQASVSIGNLRTIPVTIPPLPEQRRIAAILDQADALRAKRREALAQMDSLTQSIFIEMFGDPASNPRAWPVVALSKLIRDDDSINYGVVQPGDALDEGVPLIRVGDLVDGEFSASTLKRIDPSIESAYKRTRLRGDEVLLSCVGSIGVTVLATPAMKGFNIARAVARIPLAEGINRIFVGSYVKTDAVQNYFKGELRTVAQPTLNIKQIAETKVYSPPLALQESFAAKVQAVEALRNSHKAALAEANSLFASLQHRAFAGQLL